MQEGAAKTPPPAPKGVRVTGQMPKNVSCCTDGFRPVFFLLERVG